jgi:hypothetical protein
MEIRFIYHKYFRESTRRSYRNVTKCRKKKQLYQLNLKVIKKDEEIEQIVKEISLRDKKVKEN